VDFDASAAHGVEESGAVGVAVEGEAQGAEALAEGSDGVITHAADVTSGEIDNGEGLEHVVELRGGEANVEFLVSGDAALVLEVSDAVFVEDDPMDGKLGGLGVGGMGEGFRDWFGDRSGSGLSRGSRYEQSEERQGK